MSFSLPAMVPNLDSAVSFLPAIVFNLMGFELVATMTKEMKDVRDMPKAVFLSIGITAFLYIFGTVGILMALPVESIGLVAGLIDTFKTLFGSGPLGTAMVYLFGTFALLTLIGNMVSWTMGASRAAAEAAQEGELPAPVAKVSERGSPVGANNITGAVSTVVILSYALFAQGNDDLFWSIFAFSSCIFLVAISVYVSGLSQITSSGWRASASFQSTRRNGIPVVDIHRMFLSHSSSCCVVYFSQRHST
ncbi:amino acid permease [Vibrio sinaloensis]|nr:amino acid permease [Vibrio sinaloensis]